ncbi:hypothetical protein J6590_050825 [Homalodisca vitripennis]|nr:hypothetical protein J6590_050825 [Homalodisca vitripennis]
MNRTCRCQTTQGRSFSVKRSHTTKPWLYVPGRMSVQQPEYIKTNNLGGRANVYYISTQLGFSW